MPKPIPLTNDNLNAYVHEDIAGMSVVQSFGAEEETREIFSDLVGEHKNAFWDACRYADMFGSVIDFCWGIGAMMLYLVGIKVLGVENISVGLLVAFGTYIKKTNYIIKCVINKPLYFSNYV